MAAAAALPVRRLEPPTAAAQQRHPNVNGDSPAWGEGGVGKRGWVGVGDGVVGGGKEGRGACWAGEAGEE